MTYELGDKARKVDGSLWEVVQTDPGERWCIGLRPIGKRVGEKNLSRQAVAEALLIAGAAQGVQDLWNWKRLFWEEKSVWNTDYTVETRRSQAEKELLQSLLDEVDAGRHAALAGKGRGTNPFIVSDVESNVRRTLWDAGHIYVAGLPKAKTQSLDQGTS